MNNKHATAQIDETSPALAAFIEGAKRIYTEHMTFHFPNSPTEKFTIAFGNRYVRVCRYEEGRGESSGSVHCFVDRTNGDVLKAASWKTPAKHARGNIFDEAGGLASMEPYGPAYLR